MTLDEAKKAAQVQMAFVRFIFSWIGLVLLVVAMLEWGGIDTPVPGEFWQIAIGGMALK